MKHRIGQKAILVRQGPAKSGVTFLQRKTATHCLLFAAGIGGSPVRPPGLPGTFTRRGISVVAPCF